MFIFPVGGFFVLGGGASRGLGIFQLVMGVINMVIAALLVYWGVFWLLSFLVVFGVFMGIMGLVMTISGITNFIKSGTTQESVIYPQTN